MVDPYIDCKWENSIVFRFVCYDEEKIGKKLILGQLQLTFITVATTGNVEDINI